MIGRETSKIETSEGRNRALDGVRGLAATIVVFYHSILHNSASLEHSTLVLPIQSLKGWREMVTKLGLSIFDGEAAVFIFFVVSGLVLRSSLERQSEDDKLQLITRFTVNRLLRLYPPVIVCMALFYLVCKLCHVVQWAGMPTFSISQFLHNASLYAISMHGPSTTIQLEVMVIPFILLFFFIRRGAGVLGLLGCLIYALYAVDQPRLVFDLPNLRVYLFLFVLGMLAGEKGLGSLIRISPRAFAALLGFSFAGRLFVDHRPISSLFGLGLSSVLLVLGVYHAPQCRLRSFLEKPAIQYLGRISYSFYLLNVIFLNFLWSILDRIPGVSQHALELGLLVGTLCCLITIPFAHLLEILIEQPSIRFAKKFQSSMGALLALWVQPRGETVLK